MNPPNINSPKDSPPAAGGPPGFNDFLEWMRSQVGGAPAPGLAGQRELIPKEKKKFQRRDAEAKIEASPAPAAPTPETAAKPAVEPVPEAKPEPPATAPVPVGESNALPSGKLPDSTPEPLASRVRRQQQGNAQRNAWLGVATQAGVLIALAGSFLLGRLSVSKVVPPPLSAPAVPEVVNSDGKATTKLISDENVSLIDQALAAEQNFDFPKAEEFFGKVKASGAHVPGLSFQLGQLAAFEGNDERAKTLFNDSIAEGENVAEAYSLRATLNSRSHFIRGTGLNDYETASKLDPFNARIYFYWGQALRRAGKVQAAITRTQQAIDRLREPEIESLYWLTLRLAKIEAGQEKDFADELARQLALPNPTMDWLVTAAAVEIRKGDYAAAAGYLDKASQRGDPETFKLRVQDFYLKQFQYQKELARFYPKASSAKRGGLPKPLEEAAATPAPQASSPPDIGLQVPEMPPPASPGASLSH